MADLYIVRHGNTFEAGETPRRVGGRTDLPLTREGETQAKRLGAFFASCNVRFQLILTSPLCRTMRTAQLIAEEMGISAPHETAVWLREIDYGEDENQPEDLVRARIGDTALKAWEAEATPPPGWRVDTAGLTASWRRLFEATAAAAEADDTGAVLAVTSNGVARFALRALDIPPALSSPLKLRTGAYGVVQVTRLKDRVDAELIGWDQRP